MVAAPGTSSPDEAFSGARAETSSLWSQPVDGGAPKQLTDFKPEQIFSLDLSRDGKWLVFTRGTATRDVVLITDSGRQ